MTDDFRSANILCNVVFRPEWKIPSIGEGEQEQIRLILNQTFHYISKGAQCYALESEDGKYILKLFKSKHLIPSKFLTFQPNTRYKRKKLLEKEKNLSSVFEGYLLAYTMHRQESRLLYLHLLPQFPLHMRINLIDKMGFKWSIDADSTVFAIQKKGISLQTIMQDLLVNEQLDLAKKRMRQIFDLYFSEYQKGLYDLDHAVLRNFGFCDDEPIHIDVGMLRTDAKTSDPIFLKKDLERVIFRFKPWLASEFPQYQEEIMRDIEDVLHLS